MPEPWDKPNQPIVWYNKNLESTNRFCLYCGRHVGSGSILASDKEHLIGRDFVPRGSFFGGRSFNFIFRACKECNIAKAQLESHISSITIYNSPLRATDPQLDALARRKGDGTYHPDFKGKVVRDTALTKHLSFDFAGAKFSLRFVGGPPLKRDYVEELSYMHIKALYSLLTIKRGGSFQDDDYYRILLPEYFHVIGQYPLTDWGNATLAACAQVVKRWPCLAILDTAFGNFKVIVRILRITSTTTLWFWALEWNKHTRVVGTVGTLQDSQNVFKDLEADPGHTLTTQDGEVVTLRNEKVLSPENNMLFEGEMIQSDLL